MFDEVTCAQLPSVSTLSVSYCVNSMSYTTNHVQHASSISQPSVRQGQSQVVLDKKQTNSAHYHQEHLNHNTFNNNNNNIEGPNVS